MEKKNAILKSQTEMAELEVIGQGGMVYRPCQIGQWWVMPAEQYKGTIPPEIMVKWERFKALNLPVVGYLIADDMLEVQIKWAEEAEKKLTKAEKRHQKAMTREQTEEERQQREARWQKRKADLAQAAEVGVKVIKGVGMTLGILAAGLGFLTAATIYALVKFDPVLIAVLEDERWVCVGAWWD